MPEIILNYKKQLVPKVMEAYETLAEKYDIIVIEGAGSPAEINLKEEDIVNMGMAKNGQSSGTAGRRY